MSIRDMLCEDIGCDDSYLESLQKRLPNLYRTRRMGGRLINIPSVELRLVQRWIGEFTRAEFDEIPDHVTAYETKRSIVTNARCHASHRHVIMFDIHHFFQSCTKDMVFDLYRHMSYPDRTSGRRQAISRTDAELLTELSCCDNSLGMGSPSSPFIANRIMLRPDAEIVSLLPLGATYTRYSDDMTISSDAWLDLDDIEQTVEGVLGAYGFSLNSRKTRCAGRGSARKVTGVYVTPDGSLSLGKRRKKELRSLTYSVLMGQSDEVDRLIGLMAFCEQVDPSYLGGLLTKYASYGLARTHGGVFPALRELQRGAHR